MEPVNLISEIKPLVPSDQLDHRPRSFPFIQGQILLGRVDAQHAPHQFTLNLQGQQLLAESTVQLQVGQNIRAEVVALAPQLQLQLLPADTITPRISTGVHLLSQQQELAPQLSALAEQAQQQASTLSPEARQTLQTLGNNLMAMPVASAPLPPVTPLIAQGLAILSSNSDALPVQQLQEMATLVRQLANILPQPQSEQAAMLAERLQQGQPWPNWGAVVEPMPGMPAPAGTTPSWEELAQRLEQFLPGLQAVLQQLPNALQQTPDTAGARLVQQLFTWLANLPVSTMPPQTAPQFSAQLQQTTQQLGLHFEQLLVQEKTEAATQTAKFALMEFAQQASLDEDSATQAHSLLKSIELYQLVQIRLAAEGTQFLPLPFSFLQQGFVLIDADGGKQSSKPQGNDATDTRRLSLHLQLEGLGNLSVDIQQQGEAISLKFQAENIERAQFIGTHRQDLEQWLTSGTLQSVQFLAGAEEPVKTLLKQMVKGATGMVNTKA